LEEILKVKIAVVGGYDIFEILEERGKKFVVKTPYGESPQMMLGKLHDMDVVALPRHGEEHKLPPHMINYRANVWALKKIGVERIVAYNAVGSLRKDYKPGDFVVLSNLVDFVMDSRPRTFFEGGRTGVFHVDFTNPYCEELRSAIIKAMDKLKLRYHKEGVYVCTSGPRFETSAEIKFFSNFADVVGMTQIPESVLARELGICYASIAIVSNYGAGISENPLTHEEVVSMMKDRLEDLKRVYPEVIKNIPETRNCLCKEISDKISKILRI